MLSKSLTFSVALGAIALATTAIAVANNPYAGLEQRPATALNADDVNGYLKCYGMGYAKSAELNHYPSPLHLREVANELDLSAEVVQKITVIESDMRKKAIKLGHEIVELERQLDMMFTHAQAAPDLVTDLTKKIGLMQGELRAVHLNAHLAVRPLLSDDIVERYDVLMGYTVEETEAVETSEHNQNDEH